MVRTFTRNFWEECIIVQKILWIETIGVTNLRQKSTKYHSKRIFLEAMKSQEFCQKSLALVLHSTVVHRIPQKLLGFLWGSKMDKKELHCIKNRVEQF